MKGFLVAWIVIFAIPCFAADPQAVYVADSKSIIVDIPKKSTSPDGIYGALYRSTDDSDVLVQSFAKSSFVDVGAGAGSRFQLGGLQLDSKTTYSLRLFEYPSETGVLFFELPIQRALIASIRQTAQCPNGVEVRLSAPNSTSSESKPSIRALYAWLAQVDSHKAIAKASLQSTDATETVTFSGLKYSPGNEGQAERDGHASLCLKAQSLPVNDGQLSIQIGQAPPDILTAAIVGDFKGDKAVEFSDSDKAVGERTLEKNLDAEVTFTSSVQRDDATNTQKRSNDGVLDLRLAPWLNRLSVPAQVNHTLRYFTPIYFDAKVSTGKITDDTLSANRIAIGTEYEWRVIPDTGQNTMHRFIAGVKHLSDRDFKQLEFDADLTYKFMWNPLYKPLSWRLLDDKNAWFGWNITPSAEFEIGRTYSRRNPAPAVLPSDTARRFSNGVDMQFDFTKYAVLEVSDSYYVRGEAADNDLFHNHFAAELQLPVMKPFRNSGHSLTISFERGNVPPFATPDVNVVKVGYKFSSTRWFGESR